MTNPLIKLKRLLQSENNSYKAVLAEEGVSGTYFILDKKNKPLAVFKDAKEDPLCPQNPRVMPHLAQISLPMMRSFGFFTACEDTVAGQSFASDSVCSYLGEILTKKMGFNKITIPKAIVAKNLRLNNEVKEKGILIQWVDDAESLGKHTNLFRQLEKSPKGISIEAYEQMAVFDYITGNMDRKAGNNLIQKNTDQLYLIDNSWAFSPLQGEALSMNHFAWGGFPLLSKRTFSKATRDKISLIFQNRYQLSQIVFEEFNHLKAPGQTKEHNFQRTMCFLHRIEMIHHLMCNQRATFLKLSQTCFEDQFLEMHQAKKVILSSSWLKPNSTKLAAEKRYAILYSDKKPLTPLHRKLQAEMVRLNQRIANRDGVGFWRENYIKKADAINAAFEELLSVEPQKNETIDNLIKTQIQNQESRLYKALNMHTSFFFKFTISSVHGISTDSSALLNLKNGL